MTTLGSEVLNKLNDKEKRASWVGKSEMQKKHEIINDTKLLRC